MLQVLLVLVSLVFWGLVDVSSASGTAASHGMGAHMVLPRSAAQCEPFSMNFRGSRLSDFDKAFVPLSPSGSYGLDSDGLHLFLDRPKGKITTKGNVNDKVADGATINSTFTFLYGKVTYTFYGPAIPGVVTAAILIADQGDEIDVELVGGNMQHWQSNVFAPAPHEAQPLYIFGEIEDYPSGQKSVRALHSYTIDWNAERITWGVDNSEVRTVRRATTNKNGHLHYPSHLSRLQLGIWDASAPAGTSEWARGPIDWETAPHRMTATFNSIEVECPY
ncbi:concanavalin A-like lectin/glucanase [Trametes polyzona]|nr:concanavalin A-like lectin/glucanase [Trametes polyzona]